MPDDLDPRAEPLVYILSEHIAFPPPAKMAPGKELLAIGGDLSTERILLAYRMGIFPWPHDEHLLWFSPDPRCLLFPDKIRITNSMDRILRSDQFQITFDRDFPSVIRACRTTPRAGQPGTWITRDMVKAYTNLHELGFAHSVEAWQDGELAGGLYGLSLGGAFFGESMFTRISNASKACFITLARRLQDWGFDFIDCQLPTDHLLSLGARALPRPDFLERLESTLKKPTHQGSWRMHQ